MARAVPGALFSSSPLAEKLLSVTHLLEFLCSMRVANFQNHKQRVALPLLPVTQEGRKRAGALCPVNPRGHLPLGTSNSKTSAQLLRPSLGPALSLLGKEGSHQGAGSVPSSISSETEQWEAGWRDEARNRCRQAWPLSLSLSSEWSQQKEHLATLALPHPASSCFSLDIWQQTLLLH